MGKMEDTEVLIASQKHFYESGNLEEIEDIKI